MESILTRDHVDALLNLTAGEPSTADLAKAREVAVALNEATLLREQVLFHVRLAAADIEAQLDEQLTAAPGALDLDTPLSPETTVTPRALAYLDMVVAVGIRALEVSGEFDPIEATLAGETARAVAAAATPVLLGGTRRTAEPLSEEEIDLFYSVFSSAREDAFFGAYNPAEGSAEERRFLESYVLQDKLGRLAGLYE